MPYFPFAHQQSPMYPYASDPISGQFVSEQNQRAIFRMLFKSFCNPGGFTLGFSGSNITISAGAANIRGYFINSTQAVTIPFIPIADQQAMGIAGANVFFVWLDVWDGSQNFSAQWTGNLPAPEFTTAVAGASPLSPTVPAPVSVNFGIDPPSDRNQVGGPFYIGSVYVTRNPSNPAEYTVYDAIPSDHRDDVTPPAADDPDSSVTDAFWNGLSLRHMIAMSMGKIPEEPEYDLNNDGTVNAIDVAILRRRIISAAAGG